MVHPFLRSEITKAMLKIGKEGFLILPKKLSEEAGICEGDEVIVEVEKDGLILRALRPKVVDIDLGLVEKLLREGTSLK